MSRKRVCVIDEFGNLLALLFIEKAILRKNLVVVMLLSKYNKEDASIILCLYLLWTI